MLDWYVGGNWKDFRKESRLGVEGVGGVGGVAIESETTRFETILLALVLMRNEGGLLEMACI